MGNLIKSLTLAFGFTWLLGCNSPPEQKFDLQLQNTDTVFSDHTQIGDMLPTDLLQQDSTAQNLGGPCKTNSDCPKEYICQTNFPAGMCTRFCEEDAQCGDSSLWGCFEGLCYRQCNAMQIFDLCRDNYVCRSEGIRDLCIPHCEIIGCETGWVCDKDYGLCLNPQGGTFGHACGVNIGDCSGTPNGICFAFSQYLTPICTIKCSPFTKSCPSKIPQAECAIGTFASAYCIYLCDPNNPVCPEAGLTCKKVTNSAYVCLP